MQSEIEILQVEKKIRTRVKKQMEKSQKEYYLNEQMQAIQKELGDRDEFKNELNELEQKIKTKKMSAGGEGAGAQGAQEAQDDVADVAPRRPSSATTSTGSSPCRGATRRPTTRTSPRPSASSTRTTTGSRRSRSASSSTWRCRRWSSKLKGPILCLVGPPGVGKTSLAKSIARATGRKFVRQSLGGVRDEAEIRGHRRTYIGALPGKIIQSLKKVGTNNPVFLLDEIDKMSQDFRGDPASALLEVLDPEQNNSFNDHYLDLDYDLSDVMFITTANTQHQIPLPLQDRMRDHQPPRLHRVGEARHRPRVPDPEAARGQRDGQQAGVGHVHRRLPALDHPRLHARGRRAQPRARDRRHHPQAGQGVAGRPSRRRARSTSSRPSSCGKYLGVPKYRKNRKEDVNEIGLANGLAVTMHGGDLLPAEVTIVPGKGKLTLTGKLGEVMQESAQAAMSYIRSRCESLGLVRDFQLKVDIHVHFPEGAIPKDGPSAGITMATAVTSALLRVPVRQDIAMTGEITLRGRVLPIGGLKEKILAAHRAEIFSVIIPAENEKDLKDIPKRVLKEMTIHPVTHMDEVLKLALAHEHPEAFLPQPTSAIDWRLSLHQRVGLDVAHAGRAALAADGDTGRVAPGGRRRGGRGGVRHRRMWRDAAGRGAGGRVNGRGRASRRGVAGGAPRPWHRLRP